jgi:membrane-bound lytic murein transglycosylase MltF
MTLPAEIVPKIMRCLDLVRAGRSPTSASHEASISWGTIRRYCDKDEDLRAMMLEAVQEGQDVLADVLLEIDRDPHYGQSDASMAKVVSENIKWLLSRRRPDLYGDKSEVNINVRADRVILDALNAAKQRTVPMIELQANEDVNVEDLR